MVVMPLAVTLNSMTRINGQKIYGNMSYTVKDLATELDIDEKTCFRWIANGLKIIAGGKKPILMTGHDIKDFLKKKNAKKKVTLTRSQFYCFTCKGARNAKRGSIKKTLNKKSGTCSVCNGKMSRTI
jgi:hypothetical protein